MVISVSVPTPCGPVGVSYAVPFPPTFDLSFFFNIPFPPKFHIPMPDCGLLEHLAGTAPEDPADDLP